MDDCFKRLRRLPANGQANVDSLRQPARLGCQRTRVPLVKPLITMLMSPEEGWLAVPEREDLEVTVVALVSTCTL